MPPLALRLVVAPLWCLTVAALIIYATKDKHDENECGVWLAPSTLPGAGLGMFAGKKFAQNQALIPTGESVIGVVDLVAHNGQRYYDEGSFLWHEYFWSGKILRLDREGLDEVQVASAGFGSAANSFLPILNVQEKNPVLQWEGLQRLRDPGAGASTQFHGRLSVARRPIAAGEELFVDCEYYCWGVCHVSCIVKGVWGASLCHCCC